MLIAKLIISRRLLLRRPNVAVARRSGEGVLCLAKCRKALRARIFHAGDESGQCIRIFIAPEAFHSVKQRYNRLAHLLLITFHRLLLSWTASTFQVYLAMMSPLQYLQDNTGNPLHDRNLARCTLVLLHPCTTSFRTAFLRRGEEPLFPTRHHRRHGIMRAHGATFPIVMPRLTESFMRGNHAFIRRTFFKVAVARRLREGSVTHLPQFLEHVTPLCGLCGLLVPMPSDEPEVAVLVRHHVIAESIAKRYKRLSHLLLVTFH